MASSLFLHGGIGIGILGEGGEDFDPQGDGGGVSQVHNVLLQVLDVHLTGFLVEPDLEKL